MEFKTLRYPGHIALRVDATGLKNGKLSGTRWQMVDLYDERHGVTAMMRTTGYSLAITGIMQLDGRILRPGVFAPDEIVPAQPMIGDLAKRGVILKETALQRCIRSTAGASWRGPEQAAGACPGGRPPGGPNGVRGGSPLS